MVVLSTLGRFLFVYDFLSFKKWLIYAEKQLDNLCVGEKSGVQFPSPPPDGYYTNTYFFKGGFAVRVWL